MMNNVEFCFFYNHKWYFLLGAVLLSLVHVDIIFVLQSFRLQVSAPFH